MESRKVFYYICVMKTLKISDSVHKKLKVYLAKNGKTTITEFVDGAILSMLSLKSEKRSQITTNNIKQ